MAKNNKLSELKVAIKAHTYATGVSQVLKEFLNDKTKSLAFISHPLSFSPTLNSSVMIYEKGRIVRRINAFDNSQITISTSWYRALSVLL